MLSKGVWEGCVGVNTVGEKLNEEEEMLESSEGKVRWWVVMWKDERGEEW